MAERRVRKTGKNSDGDILSLCNDGESWSPRSKGDAINDINNGTHSYHVTEAGFKTGIYVTDDGDLKTEPDPTTANNLDNLPDC